MQLQALATLLMDFKIDLLSISSWYASYINDYQMLLNLEQSHAYPVPIKISNWLQ